MSNLSKVATPFVCYNTAHVLLKSIHLRGYEVLGPSSASIGYQWTFDGTHNIMCSIRNHILKAASCSNSIALCGAAGSPGTQPGDGRLLWLDEMGCMVP